MIAACWLTTKLLPRSVFPGWGTSSKPRVAVVPPRRGIRARSHGHRGRGASNSATAQVLLDKFVKRVSVDGGLTVTAPFALKVRGTFFDAERNVDSRRNRMAREESTTFVRHSRRNDKEEVESGRRSDSEASHSNEEEGSDCADPLVWGPAGSETDEDLLGRTSSSGEDEVIGVAREAEGKESTTLAGTTLPATSVYPLHLLLFGRNYHRLDSYSVLHPDGDRHCSHMHVCDFITMSSILDGEGGDEEAGFLQQHYRPGGSLYGLRPCGGAAVWLPHRLRSVFPDKAAEINRDGDKLVSEAKFYMPSHIVETVGHGIRGVFLVPTCLSKVSLKTERDSDIELNGQLQTQLSQVHLITDEGNIKTKDVYASKEIRINSQAGDISCEGVINGHIVAETKEDGGFLARDIDGPQITVTTDTGDINVWGDCRSDLSQFFTRVGNVNVRRLTGASYILVREAGSVAVRLADGSLTCVVKRGNITASIDNLLNYSTLQVSEGDVTVTLPSQPAFRVVVSATATNIAPRLLNSGDFYKSFEDANNPGQSARERENFNSGPYLSPHKTVAVDSTTGDALDLSDPKVPVLNIVANQGTVTVLVNESGSRRSNSSAHNTELDS